MLPLSVIVPARNAEALLPDCLESIVASGVNEIIVVDGCSTDRTVEIAETYGARVLSDEGAGLPVARLLGAEAATSYWVALIDADVVLPDGALAALFGEFIDDGYTALQAGLHSVSTDGDYWGEALAHHHRTGRSRHWFGLVATIFARRSLLEYGFDGRFSSGEDIDLRWRLQAAGEPIGVSKRTVVTHRFPSGESFARGQFDADGRGLARMARTRGARGWPLLAMPAAASLRGMTRAVVRGEPQWLRYYASYAVGNYRAIRSELQSTAIPDETVAMAR